MTNDVIISSQSLNSYGFRVLTGGIDIGQYRRNPVLLWMHHRPMGGSVDEPLPIGRMENLRVEGDNLIGTVVFDTTDDFAARIKAKWDCGMLRAVSAGLTVLEQSDDPKHLVPGQTRATITRSRLVEVSVVDIGANPDALRLYSEDNTVSLSAASEGLNLIVKPINQNSQDMNEIAIALGLPAEATQQQCLDAIEALSQKATEAVLLRAELDEHLNLAIASAVDAAIADRRITADRREHFIRLGQVSGIEMLSHTLACITPAQRASSVVNAASDNPGSEWRTLSDVPADRLEQLRDTDYDRYAALYQAEYGVKPSSN